MEKRVFYCKDCGLAEVHEHGPVTCKKCGHEMHNTGWFEYTNNESAI